MFIQFEKEIRGVDNLEGFVTSRNSEVYKRKEYYFCDYDTSAILEYGLGFFQKYFQNKEYNFRLTANNSIWVSDPEPFSLSFSVSTNNYTSSWAKVEYCEFETVGMKHDGIFKTSKPILQEIPVADLSGTIKYERLMGVDPIPVLDMLKKLGYPAKVETTSEELQEAVERANKAGHKLFEEK